MALGLWMAWVAAVAPPDVSAALPEASQTGWIGRMLTHQAAWVWFLAAFLGGLALNLTPCVYPMIPVTLAFFSGQASGRVGYTALLGVLYVIGMSLTYAVLGLVAAKTGSLLGSWLQKPFVLVGVALLVGALSFSMFGFYELRPPQRLTQRFGQAAVGRWGALIMGLTVGVIAAPCIGPFVLGLLLFVSQLANPLLGFWLFLTMGIGMGLPYLLLGIVANRTSRWPKAGSWLVWIKKLLGVCLLGLALYFLKPLLMEGTFRWLFAVLLILAGLYLGWLERSRFQGGSVWVRRLVGLALIGGAIALMPAGQGAAALVPWHPYSPARLEQAKQEGRPALIDVYAEWCLPCVELDHVTFRHPDVVEGLSDFVTLRVDATREVSPTAQELLERYEVYGVPTILVFDADGREREDLRVTGFIRPKELLARLARVRR